MYTRKSKLNIKVLLKVLVVIVVFVGLNIVNEKMPMKDDMTQPEWNTMAKEFLANSTWKEMGGFKPEFIEIGPWKIMDNDLTALLEAKKAEFKDLEKQLSDETTNLLAARDVFSKQSIETAKVVQTVEQADFSEETKTMLINQFNETLKKSDDNVQAVSKKLLDISDKMEATKTVEAPKQIAYTIATVHLGGKIFKMNTARTPIYMDVEAKKILPYEEVEKYTIHEKIKEDLKTVVNYETHQYKINLILLAFTFMFVATGVLVSRRNRKQTVYAEIKEGFNI